MRLRDCQAFKEARKQMEEVAKRTEIEKAYKQRERQIKRKAS